MVRTVRVPLASLIFDGSGNLYGTTTSGGSGAAGTAFKLDRSGGLTTLHSFNASEGIPLAAALVLDGSGNLYGTTASGGSSDNGTVFKLDGSGNFTTLHTFAGPDGAHPYSALILDATGNLYGTTGWGGAVGYGTVFRLDSSGSLTTLHSFTSSDGGYPWAALILDASGNLWGTTVFGGAFGSGTVFKLDSSGGLTVHSLTSPDGFFLNGAVVADVSGNLYGTAFLSGSNGWGTVFKLDPAGNLTTLHSFNLSDGANPFAALIRDAAGDLYGTTVNSQGPYGGGTVFKLDSSGNLTTLHNFSGSDGAQPYASLILDASGNLYGTTYGSAVDYGTVFKLDSSDSLTTLHTFYSYVDGANPWAAPILDAAGNLWGTTSAGGSGGDGTVFKLDHAGSLTRFNIGGRPYASLILDPSGNLIGTTSAGGANGQGSIFRLDSSGNLTTLHSFNGSDGSYPWASLLLDTSGNLYGTTSLGGAGGYGTVFKLDGSGSLTTLHSFNSSGGAGPRASLILDAAGSLYGTTTGGGAGGGGVVFRFSTTSEPFSISGVLPTSGRASVRTLIDIMGTGFQDEPTVTIGGAAASGVSLVDSHNLIALTPPLSPGTLNDVVVSDPGSSTLPAAFFADFLDVPHLDIFHDFVETIFRRGITIGYGNGNFGRDDAVTRAQMAVFLLKAQHGAGYAPPTCTGVFADVPCTPGVGFPDWIEQLYRESITSGCFTDPLRYCPDRGVRRDEMAVFLLRTEHDNQYVPPACTGIFADVPCTPGVGFSDWIEALSNQGVTGGCYVDPLRYCPDRSSARGEMAVFLVKAFGL